MEGGDRPPSALAPPLTLYHPAPDRDPRRPLANDALGGALPLVVCFFFCFGWFLQTCRSRWYCTAQLLGHNGESRVTLGGTSHRHSCFRHNWESRITLGGESHRHSCRAQLGKLVLVAHVLDACCRAHVLDATQLPVSALLLCRYCCRCIAAALPLHCRCIAAALLRPCCRSCPAALTAVVTATI